MKSYRKLLILLLALQISVVSFAQVGSGRNKKKNTFNDLIKAVEKKLHEKPVKKTKYASLPSGAFIIQSAMNYGRNKGGCWDIPGGKNPKLKNGKNVEIWECNGGKDQHFRTIWMSGQYYCLYSFNNRKYVVNVDGGKTANGTNVELWSKNSNNRQKLKFKHLGGGKYKIYTYRNKVLCLSNRSNKNGTNIHTWDDHNGAWTEWYILNAYTKKPILPDRYHEITENINGAKIPANKKFRIQSAIAVGTNKGFIGASGSSFVPVTTKSSSGQFEMMRVEGYQYYSIHSCKKLSKKLLPLRGKENLYIGESGSKSGSSIYRFEHVGNGKFKIIHNHGKLLGLGRLKIPFGNKKVSTVVLKKDTHSSNTLWYLIDQYGNKYIPN